MNESLRELRGMVKPNGDDKSLVSLELEVEYRKNPQEVSTEYWKTKEDHSLRHMGREYISNKPFNDTNYKRNINFMCGRINKSLDVVKESPRTSVHVHVNMQEETIPTIDNNMFLYWLFEDILFDVCGPHRKKNMYCLQLKDAPGIIEWICTEMTNNTSSPFSAFTNNDNIRYSGLNVCALPRFGTLEYRGMEGVYDPDKIVQWVECLLQLKEVSKKFTDPSEIATLLIAKGGVSLFEELMKDSIDFIKKHSDHTTWRERIDASFDLLLPIIASVNWKNRYDSIHLVYNKRKEILAKNQVLIEADFARVEEILNAANIVMPRPRARR